MSGHSEHRVNVFYIRVLFTQKSFSEDAFTMVTWPEPGTMSSLVGKRPRWNRRELLEEPTGEDQAMTMINEGIMTSNLLGSVVFSAGNCSTKGLRWDFACGTDCVWDVYQKFYDFQMKECVRSSYCLWVCLPGCVSLFVPLVYPLSLYPVPRTRT